jgi:hypothetical protein
MGLGRTCVTKRTCGMDEWGTMLRSPTGCTGNRCVVGAWLPGIALGGEIAAPERYG